MPDKFDALADLAREAEDVPMLPAAEIRRRGDQRRTRRHVGITAGALGVTVLAAATVWSTTINRGSNDDPQWAGTPSVTVTSSTQPTATSPTVTTSTVTVPPSDSPTSPTHTTASPSATSASPEVPPTTPSKAKPSSSRATTLEPLSWESMPTSKEIYAKSPGDLTVSAQGTDWGQAASSFCQMDSPPVSKSVRMRQFDNDDQSHRIAVVGMDFTSAAEASAARKEILNWYRNCGEGPIISREDVGLDVPVERVTVPEAAKPFSAVSARAKLPNYGEEAGTFTFENTLVIQANNRLLLVTEMTFLAKEMACEAIPGGESVMCPIYDNVDAIVARFVK